MSLPSVDLEMTYWRARRRMQRLRAACRDRVSRIRAELNLRCMYRRARRPAQWEPEETFIYRSMWAVVVAGLILVITIESVGQDEFMQRVDAVVALSAHPRNISAGAEAVRPHAQANS